MSRIVPHHSDEKQHTVQGPVRPRTLGGVEAAVRGDATIDDLALVVAGWPRPMLTDIPVFACVECGKASARVVDPARWRCSSCGFLGTIFALRRVVMESAVLLERLLDLLAAPTVDIDAEDTPDVWATS